MEERDRPFFVLALDGGGARGIYPAQILNRIEEELGLPTRCCFDLIAGTSTGAIVAGAAATAVQMKKVVKLFESKSQQLFRKSPFRTSLLGSRYSLEPLKRAVQDSLPALTLGEVDTPLMITSSDLTTGSVNVFKSRYIRDLGEPYVRDQDIRLTEAIVASCAAPLYFNPSRIGASLLADGGLWANNPSVLALTEAVSRFERCIENVHILSIGTGRSVNLYGSNKYWGLMTGWGKEKLVSFVFDLQSQASENMATLLLGERHVRLNPDIEEWGLDETRHLANLKAMADMDFARQYKRIICNTRKRND